MDEKKLLKLIDKSKYQVFLLSSPVPFPYFFGLHYWFVINLKGKIHRWEFGDFRGSPHLNGIGVLKDFLKPEIGMNFYLWKENPRFKSKIAHYISGDKNSVAEKMAKFIEKNAENYPLKKEYGLFGPNSNTFAQWIIDKFPKSKFKLSWRAIGKSYEIK